MRIRLLLIAAAVLLVTPLARPASTDQLLELAELHMRHLRFPSAQSYYEKAAEDSSGVYAHLGIQEIARRTGGDVLERYEQRYLRDPSAPSSAFLYSELVAPERALEVLKRASESTFFVHLGRAKALREMGKSEAATEIENARRKCPEDPRALGLLAGYYEDGESYERARDHFEGALALAPKRIEALVGLGNTLRLLGEFDESLELLKKAEDLDKEDPELYYRLGLTHHDRGEWEPSITAFTRALGFDPKNVDIILALGDAFRAKGEIEDAARHFENAVTMAPRRTDARRRFGAVLEIQDKNDDALTQYKEIARLDPLDFHCRVAIGWILLKKGKYDPALKEFRQAADLNPEDATALFFVGYTYDLRGRWSEAVDAYEKLLRKDPEYARAWNNIGLDHDLLGKTPKALKCLKKAVDLDPGNPDYALNLGNAYYNAKKYKDAVSVFSDVVDIDPEMVQGWTGLGRSQKALRRYDEAAKAYEKAVELDPEDADLHLLTGIIYHEHLKKYAKALEHYEEYLKQGGGDPVVEKWMEDCRKKLGKRK